MHDTDDFLHFQDFDAVLFFSQEEGQKLAPDGVCGSFCNGYICRDRGPPLNKTNVTLTVTSNRLSIIPLPFVFVRILTGLMQLNGPCCHGYMAGQGQKPGGVINGFAALL